MNWDMDQSFRDWNLDSYQYLLERVAEGRRGRNPGGTALGDSVAAHRRGSAVPRLSQARRAKGAEPSAYSSISDGTVRALLDHRNQLQVRRLDYLPACGSFSNGAGIFSGLQASNG